MAIAATLTVAPAAPNHGDTVTATYAVTGNDGIPAVNPVTESIAGDATVGTQVVHVTTSITIPGTPAVPPLPQSYAVPTAAGLTFVATANPAVFTALVP